MPVHYLNLLSDHYISQYRKGREDRWKGGLSVDNKERNMIDLQAVGQVANAGPTFICMGDDDHFMPAIDELC